MALTRDDIQTRTALPQGISNRAVDAPVRDLPVQAPNRAPEAPSSQPFTPAERDALILGNYDLVKSIARKIRARLPRGVDVDDLIGYGVVGLIESIDRYDGSRSVPFEAFARPRIQGAILDALRAIDWVPRSVRRKADLLHSATEDIREKIGRAPNREELAKAVGVPVEKLERLERGARIRTITSLDAPVGGDGDATLGSMVAGESEDVLGDWEQAELTDEIVEAVKRLPERERVAVSMYYLGERSLKEIGSELGVSESRACQLRRQGVERLRFKVRHHLD
ncbi:MAG: FliA/WhiG family RNA polymerase sigma factor [Alphaproteobacteria bacterium]|nr:FliA/WhiG family RNA polymerase sigma factor [Alphaproteobacteria bacterium]